jgi:ACS family hexuronate transporter-like MFS transporter
MSPSSPSRFAWLVLGLLFAGSVVNYVDRAALAVVKPQICAELSITNQGYGLALNAFLVAYMVLYVVGGRVADRLGYYRTFLLTISLWSVANMMHAAVAGLLSLCLFRAVLGIGEGGFYPVALRGSAEWFPRQIRSKAVGVYLCGLSLGTLITPPIVAWITLRHGWRACFLVTGALGFFLIPPWVTLHRRIRQVYGRVDPAPGLEAASNPRTPTEEELSLGAVLRRRKYWCMLGARALSDGAWWFFLVWMPGYFQEVRHFDLAMVGRWLWMPYLGADLGALAGGWLAAMLIRRGLSASFGRKLVLVPSGIFGALGTLVYFVGNPFLALGLLSVALFGHLSWATNVHTAVSEISPRRHQAVLYGITGAAGTLAGALTQPLIGYVVDVAGYAPAFVCVGIIYLLAIVSLVAAGRIEPLR